MINLDNALGVTEEGGTLRLQYRWGWVVYNVLDERILGRVFYRPKPDPSLSYMTLSGPPSDPAVVWHSSLGGACAYLRDSRSAPPPQIDSAALHDEVERLRAILSGRCLAGITHRGEDHRQSTCILAADHETAHDDGLGCTWTDADHWQPDAMEVELDALRAAVQRVRLLAGRWRGGYGSGTRVEDVMGRQVVTVDHASHAILEALDGAE